MHILDEKWKVSFFTVGIFLLLIGSMEFLEINSWIRLLLIFSGGALLNILAYSQNRIGGIFFTCVLLLVLFTIIYLTMNL